MHTSEHTIVANRRLTLCMAFSSIVHLLNVVITGYFVSRLGLSVGWMLGALLYTGFIAVFYAESGVVTDITGEKLAIYLKNIGQVLLALQVGQQFDYTVLQLLKGYWPEVMLIQAVSLIISTMFGLGLYRWSKDGLLTCLYAVTPGGTSYMPGIAEEMGANPAAVSMVQTMRILLIVTLIPLLCKYLYNPYGITDYAGEVPVPKHHGLYGFSDGKAVVFTVLLTLFACAGAHFAHKLRIPAPILVGGIVGACVLELSSSAYLGVHLSAWMPLWLKRVTQICLGASIGLRLKKTMFEKTGKMMALSLIVIVALIVCMLMLGAAMSRWLGIPLITSILSLAPGGIAEMTITAITVKADVSFVAAVQMLRILIICLVLPSLFRIIQRAKS